jgi:hypothetical protein
VMSFRPTSATSTPSRNRISAPWLPLVYYGPILDSSKESGDATCGGRHAWEAHIG